MKILFLAQRVPYPPNRGDKITTWRLVERMSRRHEVRCLGFASEPSDYDAAETLSSKGIATTAFPLPRQWRSLPSLLTSKPLTLRVYGSKELQATVDREIGSCHLSYAYSSSMGAFLEPHADIPLVMHFAELDSDKWHQYAERTRPPMRWVYAREARTLLTFERRIAASSAENVFCTPLEQRIFKEQIPGRHSIVMRNGVDLEYYRPAPGEAQPGQLVFVGMMDYYPNIDGCVHFVSEILPEVRKRFPEARLSIVGGRPTPEVQRLAQQPGVNVTGFVDDTRTHLRRAAISIAPLRIARGIQNKVLEALAMGLPLVGTTSATQGTDGEPGRDFLLANSPAEQIEAVCSLLADPARARELGARGRRFVEERYDWEKVYEPLDELVLKLARK